MANPPPVQSHNSREHSQVTTAMPTTAPSALEFSETTTVSLEWRLTGLRAMYESSKGESKSKCIKSAIFGDPDNLWEVLWYPNSGAQGGDHASLYLSCVPTQQERELALGNKWVRKGLWWFRFEVKVSEERTGKLQVIASKDASDHTFAAKTGNWGWQQFAKRDQLFLHPAVIASDSFIIVCTISSQPQPPAGYWLGLTVPSRMPSVSGSPNPMAWTGGEGASGGIAGGTMAAGGPKRVVPRDLVSAVGDLFDDPMYSDVEFVVVPSSHKARQLEGERPIPRRLYANKKLLNRCEYFDALFHGGFREVEGTIDEDDIDDDVEVLSDSDQDDELEDLLDGPLRGDGTDVMSPQALGVPIDDPITPGPTKTEHHSNTSGDVSANVSDGEEHSIDETDGGGGFTTEGESGGEGGGGVVRESRPGTGAGGAGNGGVGEMPVLEEKIAELAVKSENTAGSSTKQRNEIAAIGPRKTRIIVRDAAWSTWWAVLYWLYTDTIYFAPLSSSFAGGNVAGTPSRHTRAGSVSLTGTEPRSRREWIAAWLSERGYANPSASPDEVPSGPVGPRPVSAKAVYRLADRLDLPALRLRAFQHICGQLTAQNIPAEVFSRFSSTFEEVRKVQVAFFLKHWGEIKKSETMQNIWKQIRDGKHVGFEEVWPLIVGQLDFRPS